MLVFPSRAGSGTRAHKEAFVVVRCSFQGETFSRCVYIWVDKDFAIGRGIHQGYPKKLGSM